MTKHLTLALAFMTVAALPGCAAGPPLALEPFNTNDGFAPAYVDDHTRMEFMRIPAGSFTMGSPGDEKGRDPDEGPPHTVQLDAFYLGKYEVTQAQWQKVMEENPSKSRGHANLPVENVSWEDVRLFLQRMKEQTGISYRLPTEAEWEYACRAGTAAPFFSGGDNQTLIEYAWFSLNAGGESHLVGRRLPNDWGLYDMHGNVSEWIGDGRRGYLSRAAKNPRGPQSMTTALHRGGSWLYPPRLCRSANRMTYEKKVGTHIIGLRLALDRDAVSP